MREPPKPGTRAALRLIEKMQKEGLRVSPRLLDHKAELEHKLLVGRRLTEELNAGYLALEEQADELKRRPKEDIYLPHVRHNNEPGRYILTTEAFVLAEDRKARVWGRAPITWLPDGMPNDNLEEFVAAHPSPATLFVDETFETDPLGCLREVLASEEQVTERMQTLLSCPTDGFDCVEPSTPMLKKWLAGKPAEPLRRELVRMLDIRRRVKNAPLGHFWPELGPVPIGERLEREAAAGKDQGDAGGAGEATEPSEESAA